MHEGTNMYLLIKIHFNYMNMYWVWCVQVASQHRLLSHVGVPDVRTKCTVKVTVLVYVSDFKSKVRL